MTRSYWPCCPRSRRSRSRTRGRFLSLPTDSVEDLVDVTASGGGTRTFDISDAAQNDAAIHSLRTLHERLASQFPLVRTITVANQGE